MPGKRFPVPAWPASPSRPPMPDLSEGSCVTGTARLDPGAWTSEDPALRLAARRACLAPCPVLAECRRWALSLPGTGGTAVIGGLYQHERAAARRAAKRHNGDMNPGGQD